MTRIAFIGLGNMGRPMASRLVEAGYDVHGSDLAESAREELEAVGGTFHESSAEAAAGADVVILMLPNSAVVESVVRADGFLDSVGEESIIIDMSSSEPARTRALHASFDAIGIRLIDAPVSGGVKGAINGALTIMVGAGPAELELARPVLEHLGRVKHAGTVGAGHAVKALNNLMSAAHLLVTSEAMTAGERFGIDPAVMLEIVNGSSGRSGSTDNKWPNFILPGTFDSGFGLRLMLKDMTIAVDLAEQLGVEAGLSHVAAEHWSRAAEALPAGADHTEIARWVETLGQHRAG